MADSPRQKHPRSRRVFICDVAAGTLRAEMVPASGDVAAPMLFLALGAAAAVLLALSVSQAVYGPLVFAATAGGCLGLTALLVIIVRREKECMPSTWRSALSLAGVRRALRGLEARRTVTDFVLRRALDLVVPVCLVGLLFSGLQIWLESGLRAPAAARTILWLEETATWLHGYSAWLKPSAWFQALAVAAILVLSLLTPVVGRLGPAWKSASPWLRRAYITIVLLASVTFFGTAHGDVAGLEEARLKGELEAQRQGYAAVEAELERELVQAVVTEFTVTTDLLPGWSEVVTSYGRTSAILETLEREGVSPPPHSWPWPQRSPPEDRPSSHPGHASDAQRSSAEREWTSDRARDVREQVRRARQAREARQPPASAPSAPASAPSPAEQNSKAVVEKIVDGIYSDHVGKPLEAALGGHELISIALDVVLHSPIKETIKPLLDDVARAVLRGHKTLAAASDEIRGRVRASLRGLSSPGPARATAAQRLTDFKRASQALEAQIPAFISKRCGRRYQARCVRSSTIAVGRACSCEWTRSSQASLTL